MLAKVRVILVTDGDRVAQRVIEKIARDLNLRCISASAGNPTPLNGKKIVELSKEVPFDPVLIMFDDRGLSEQGEGETALKYVATHPDIEVIGALAVASNTSGINGVHPDLSVDSHGKIVYYAVDKYGKPSRNLINSVILGDTVDILNELNIPLIVGIGDIGKMDFADDITIGSPVTRKAIEEILKRSEL